MPHQFTKYDYERACRAAREARTIGIEGTRPYDTGWGILAWIEQVVDGRTFYATSDVQHAYNDLGLEGVVLRAQVALDALGDDAPTCELGQAWGDLASTAAAEIEEATR